MFKQILLLLFFCGISNSIIGQRPATDTTRTSTTTVKKKSSFTSIFYGQPGKAALYGLILPGAGQLYNRRYWKFPIVIAIEGYTIKYLADQINTFKQVDQCWKSYVIDASNPDIGCALGPGTADDLESLSEAFDKRDKTRSAKEAAWLIMGAVHLMQLVEAFVDRHLINFDTNEDLSFHNIPSREVSVHRMELQAVPLFTFRIPLGSK